MKIEGRDLSLEGFNAIQRSMFALRYVEARTGSIPAFRGRVSPVRITLPSLPPHLFTFFRSDLLRDCAGQR